MVNFTLWNQSMSCKHWRQKVFRWTCAEYWTAVK